MCVSLCVYRANDLCAGDCGMSVAGCADSSYRTKPQTADLQSAAAT